MYCTLYSSAVYYSVVHCCALFRPLQSEYRVESPQEPGEHLAAGSLDGGVSAGGVTCMCSRDIGNIIRVTIIIMISFNTYLHQHKYHLTSGQIQSSHGYKAEATIYLES